MEEKRKKVTFGGRNYEVVRLQSPTYLQAVLDGRFKAVGPCDEMQEPEHTTPELYAIPYSSRLFAAAAETGSPGANILWNLTPVL